jgi:hypothetical protein
MERVFKSFSLKYVPCTFCLCMCIPLGVIHAPGSEFGHIVLLGDAHGSATCSTRIKLVDEMSIRDLATGWRIGRLSSLPSGHRDMKLARFRHMASMFIPNY